MNVNEFIINNYDHLKSLKIGKNSFTKRKSSSSNDSCRSFHILNCPELKSIEIDEYSFSDYGGGFELKNLPKLHSIMIKSFNFCSSSFIVHGNIFYMFTYRSSEFEFCSIRCLCFLWFLIHYDIKYLNEWIGNRSSTIEFHQTW